MSKWRLLALILVTGLAADQATKFLAVDRLTTALARPDATLGERVRGFYTLKHLEAYSREPYVVWAPMWRMRYAENPGAAWGFMRDLSEGSRTLFFGAVVLAATVFILLYLRRLAPDQRVLQAALSMVLTGAWGNYVDRLARGYVVDFVDWHWWKRPDLYWPTFNVADSLIVVGVGLLLLLPEKKATRKVPE
ncbi:MAG: signal peptidase II [Anaeromyxobacteraceae bacterium]|nr:signal peptidase II [Anaeromyxobacteraceae bacterium]